MILLDIYWYRDMYKLLRRNKARLFIFCIIFVSLLLCLYYVSQIQVPTSSSHSNTLDSQVLQLNMTSELNENLCPNIEPRKADIDTQEEFKNFDFQVNTFLSM